jgi:hypothetical protein
MPIFPRTPIMRHVFFCSCPRLVRVDRVEEVIYHSIPPACWLLVKSKLPPASWAAGALWPSAASGLYHWLSLASVAPHSPEGAAAPPAAAAAPHSSVAPSQLPPWAPAKPGAEACQSPPDSVKPVVMAAGPTSSAEGSFSSSTFSSASASGSRSSLLLVLSRAKSDIHKNDIQKYRSTMTSQGVSRL